MSCPFLHEARVRSCQAAPVRKLIVRGISPGGEERCDTPAHTDCRIFQQSNVLDEAPGRCPFLHEMLMQYCGVAAVPKMVPFSESQLTRCGSDSFRYCESYLEISRPRHNGAAASGAEVEGIKVPERLHYSANHMWLDFSDGGTCHIGIDAFLARLLVPLERISFVTLRGVSRPSVVLTLGGADWPMVFPNALLVSGANVYLRGDPSRLASDPYGTGWLFEGCDAPSALSSRHKLMEGSQALHWMAGEVQRLNAFVQECAANRQPGAEPALCDGGAPVTGLLSHLTRDEVFRLFSEFFDPNADWITRK